MKLPKGTLHRLRRDAEGLGPLVGDQIYVAAPCLIFSAHGFAEACIRRPRTLLGAPGLTTSKNATRSKGHRY